MDPLEVAAEEVAAAEAAGPVVQTAQGSGVVASAVQRLLEPAPVRPEAFREGEVARRVNEALAGAYGVPVDVASRAEVGESLALCGRVLLGAEGSGTWSPLGYLAWSVVQFLYEASGSAPRPPRNGAGPG